MQSRSIFPFLASLLALLCQGCAPSVMCTVETVVLPDYTTRRAVKLVASPNPGYPNQRPRLGDYFQFPPAELYETYLAQPESAVFAGVFDSFENIPPDIVRPTPGSQRLAGNAFSFRVMDLILVVLADFDETIHDIVESREDGQAALAELVRLIVPELTAVLNARYGQRFDLSRFESWLVNDLPHKLQRLYGGAWDIHAAKRSGVTSPGEVMEIYLYLCEEAKKEGLELAPPGTPNLEQENMRRLREFAIKKAQELCPPRQQGGQALSGEMLSGSTGEELLGALQKTVIARHGSINQYIGKIQALIPRAFGAFLAGSAMPLYMLPETSYYYRLRVPGIVLQTNAARDINGDLLWTFVDGDLALTGQSMWARTLYIREAVANALGVGGFPSSIAEVDRLFGLCLTPSGEPREVLLDALHNGVVQRGLAPLEALASDASSPDSGAARGVLELLAKYRNHGAAAPQPQPQAQSAPPPQAQIQPPPQGQPATAQQPPRQQQPAVSSNITPVPGAAGGDPLAPIQPLGNDPAQGNGVWNIAPPPLPQP